MIPSTPRADTAPDEQPLRFPRYSSGLALALSGGGARAAYQAGVLAGLAARLPNLRFPILTGVSAGAINTAVLASQRGPLPDAVAVLLERWRHLTSDVVFRLAPARLARSAIRWTLQTLLGRTSGPTSLRGVLVTAPLRDFLMRHVDLDAIDANLAAGHVRAVAVTAASYTAGRSVTFVQGGPDIPMWSRAMRESVRTRLTVDHIMASCAIPLLFPAVRIGDEFYGDGGVRQTAPLAPALHLGARAVLAISLRNPSRARSDRPAVEYPASALVLGQIFDTVFLDALDADVEHMERVNTLLRLLPPGVPAPGGLRTVSLLLIRPSRDLGVLALQHAARLPRRVRWLVGRLGGRRIGSHNFLSYLLFEPSYTSALVELGQHDVNANWPAFERFFEGVERMDEEHPRP